MSGCFPDQVLHSRGLGRLVASSLAVPARREDVVFGHGEALTILGTSVNVMSQAASVIPEEKSIDSSMPVRTTGAAAA
jgi:hypothetical protein